MQFALELLLQVGYAIAVLVLTSIGLAVAFGMMRVINFAHGEFLMIGGFVTVFAVHAGINVWIAMFIVAPLALGLFGALLERIIIRQLYGRILDSVLATWGLSLLLIGAAAAIVGYNEQGIAPPLGSYVLAGHRQSYYSLFVIGVTIAVVGGLYLFLRRTKFGLIARGTMQNSEMAAAVGINPYSVYTITFALSAALAGFAGAVMVPITGVVPSTGATYVTQAFITVITGGINALSGTVTAGFMFGATDQFVTSISTPVLGEAVMFALAIVLLRVMPAGITGRFFQRGL